MGIYSYIRSWICEETSYVRNSRRRGSLESSLQWSIQRNGNSSVLALVNVTPGAKTVTRLFLSNGNPVIDKLLRRRISTQYYLNEPKLIVCVIHLPALL